MSRYSSKPKHGAQRNKLGKPYKMKKHDMTKLHESKLMDEKLKVAHKKADYEEKMKMARVMREYKAGKLRTSTGAKVTSKSQAVAIALSEASAVKGQPQHVEREGHDYPVGGKPGDKFNDEGSKEQERILKEYNEKKKKNLPVYDKEGNMILYDDITLVEREKNNKPLRSTPPSVRKAVDKHQAKTKVEWTVQGNYGGGWEDLTSEDKAGEISARLKEYNENEPEYRHRIVKRRVATAEYKAALQAEQDSRRPDAKPQPGPVIVTKGPPLARNQTDIQQQYFAGTRTKGKKASTSIDGDKIYSYGTVIGVKKGRTFYLNDNKYSMTTSKMQGKLASEATRQGYTVVRVKPEQKSGRQDNDWADKL